MVVLSHCSVYLRDASSISTNFYVYKVLMRTCSRIVSAQRLTLLFYVKLGSFLDFIYKSKKNPTRTTLLTEVVFAWHHLCDVDVTGSPGYGGYWTVTVRQIPAGEDA